MAIMTPFVTRFAPSPTGYLHLGHVYSAELAFRAAQAAGGRFLLRIEDTDHTRCRPTYDAAILEDLAWLGLSWEPGVRRQSAHMADYAAALQALAARGLVYRCFKTRKELLADIAHAPHEAPQAVTDGPASATEEAALLAAGRPFAWRLSLVRVAQALGPQFDRLGFEADGAWVKADPSALGDVVVARKDFPASYHLAVVIDDAAQGVTDVIRGEDLRPMAHLHVLLQALLGLPSPRYRHHRLLAGADGKRLSKRAQALTVRALRDAGRTPAEVHAMAAAAPTLSIL